MIQLALNYSHVGASLLSRGEISLDRFKTPDWLEMVQEADQYCPVAVHFNLFTGKNKLAETDWAHCEDLMKSTNTPYINIHLSAERQEFPSIPINKLKGRYRKHLLERLITDVQSVISHFGRERVILENVPFRGEHEAILRPATEAGVIRQIVEETGCGFLLDISHARISACYLGLDEYQYISELPIQAMREMHFTGLGWIKGKLKDHLHAQAGDWRMLSWALERVRQGDWPEPWLLAFEYGGVGEKYSGRTDPKIITEQLPILAEMVKSAGSA